MSLTETQKEQIRYMVSCNPSIENMERVAELSDEAVLEELEGFKTEFLPRLQQEKQIIEQESQNLTNHLNLINNLITLLNA